MCPLVYAWLPATRVWRFSYFLVALALSTPELARAQHHHHAHGSSHAGTHTGIVAGSGQNTAANTQVAVNVGPGATSLGWSGSGGTFFSGNTGFYGNSAFYGNHGWGGYGYSGVRTGYAWPIVGSGYLGPSSYYTGGYYGGPYYGSPAYGGPYWGGAVVAPPVFLPAETLYGVGPIRRLMGLDPPLPNLGAGAVAAPQVNIVNNPPVNNPAGGGAQPGAGGFGVLAPGGGAPAGAANARVSNAQARQRAARLIEIGDDYFRKQKFHDAQTRYREATTAAPDIGDGYGRQGLALTALGQYPQAAKLLKRCLNTDPRWPLLGIRLEQVFGDNKAAKTACWETLAQAAGNRPQDADLMFLVGVQLWLDGQVERAGPFFERAKFLELGDASHLAPFLDALPKPAAPKGAPAERQRDV